MQHNHDCDIFFVTASIMTNKQIVTSLAKVITPWVILLTFVTAFATSHWVKVTVMDSQGQEEEMFYWGLWKACKVEATAVFVGGVNVNSTSETCEHVGKEGLSESDGKICFCLLVLCT
jgi:hypothetical protein